MMAFRALRYPFFIAFTLMLVIILGWRATHSLTTATVEGLIAFIQPATNHSAALLKFYSPDAQLVHALTLPEGRMVYAPALAPDGRHWLSWSGAVSGPEVAAAGQPLQADYTFHIYRTSDGAEVSAIPLLPPNFPDNIALNAELMLASDPSLGDLEMLEESIWQVFKGSLGEFAWSPDGKQLAFSAAIDGPSTDLYLYDTESKSITRLTDGITQTDGIRWSPDGQWIWHSSIAYGYCQVCGGNHYAAAADGSGVVTLPGNDIYRFLAWVDGDSYLVTDQANGPGDFALQRVDLPTGTSEMLWAGTHRAFVYDEAMNRLGIIGTRGQIYDPNEQVFVLDLVNGTESEYEDLESALEVEAWLAPLSASPINHPCHRPGPIVSPCIETPYDSRSPDGEYWVSQTYSVEETSSGEEVLPSLSGLLFGRVLWRPDNAGFFITQTDDIVYRDLATGDTTRIEDASLLGWLPYAGTSIFTPPAPAPAGASTATPTSTPLPGPTPVATPLIDDIRRSSTLEGSYPENVYRYRMAHIRELATISQQLVAEHPGFLNYYRAEELHMLLAREAAATFLDSVDGMTLGPEIDTGVDATLEAQVEQEVNAALDSSLAFTPPWVANYPASGYIATLYSLAVSPDGKWVATGHTDGSVRLWDYAGGFLLRTLPTFNETVRYLQFSSDSARVAATDSSGHVVEWDVEEGMRSTSHTWYSIGTAAIAWRPYSYDLAIAHNGSPLLIDPNRGDLYPLLEESAEALAYNPDGTQLAVALSTRAYRLDESDEHSPFQFEERPIWIVDPDTGELLREVADYNRTDYISYTPDGERLITVGGRILRAWDVATATLIFESELPDFPNGWAITSDGETIAILTRRAGISFYSLSDGANLSNVPTDADSISWLAIHPIDGKLISGANDGRPVVIDATTGIFNFRFEAPMARLVTTSPATTLFATVDTRVITVRDLSGDRRDQELADATSLVIDLAISPDGEWLAALERQGNLLLWDLDRGSLVWRAPVAYLWNGFVKFAPDGRLVVAGDDGVLRLVDPADGRELEQLVVEDRIEALAVSSRNEAAIAVGLPEGVAYRINLDDLAAGALPIPVMDGEGWIFGNITYSPDGSLLALPRRASYYTNYVVELWETTNYTRVRTIATEEQFRLTGLAFSPDGERLATGPSDLRPITIWEVATGQELQRLGEAKAVPESDRLAFSPDGTELFSSAFYGITTRFALTPNHSLRTIQAHRGGVWDVDVTPDGRTAMTVADDRRLRIWDWQTGVLQPYFIEEPDRISSVDYTTHGVGSASGAILTGGNEGALRVYYPSGLLHSTFWGHRSWIIDAIFSPDGDFIASASNDNSVRVWDRARVAQSWAAEDLPWGVTAIAYSPDGALLAASVGIGADAAIIIWDAYSGEELMQLRGHRNFSIALSFNPDGSLLASASWDRTIKLWDVATGTEVATLEGHTDILTDMTFSPDGTRIASTAEDYTLRLWDVATRTLLTTIDIPRTLPWSVAFSHDGKALLTTHADGTLRTWLTDLDDNSLAAKTMRAGARVSRASAEFTAAEREQYVIDSRVGTFHLSVSGKVNWEREPFVKSLIVQPRPAGVMTETLFALASDKFLYTSVNHGESWRIITQLPLTYTFEGLAIPARPTDPLLITGEDGIYRVGDDGSLTLVNSGSFDAISYSHTNPNELWAISDTEILKSEDGGATWGTAYSNLLSNSLFGPLLLTPANNNPQLVGGIPHDNIRRIFWRGAGNGFWERLTSLPYLPYGAMATPSGLAWDAGNRILYLNGANGELYASTNLDAPTLNDVSASIVEQFGIGSRPVPLAIGEGPTLYINLMSYWGSQRLLRGTWDGNQWHWIALRLPNMGLG